MCIPNRYTTWANTCVRLHVDYGWLTDWPYQYGSVKYVSVSLGYMCKCRLLSWRGFARQLINNWILKICFISGSAFILISLNTTILCTSHLSFVFVDFYHLNFRYCQYYYQHLCVVLVVKNEKSYFYLNNWAVMQMKSITYNSREPYQCVSFNGHASHQCTSFRFCGYEMHYGLLSV